jgi:hypothetical protein
MRFALAASILGWTLPLPQASQAFREEMWEWTTILQGRIRNDVASLSRRQTLREKVFQKRGLPVQNSHYPQHIAEEKECDPTSVDSDIGILGCGHNEYCVTSESSILGGRCVPALSLQQLRRVQEDSSDNGTYQSLIDYGLSYFCELPFCTCSNVNEAEYTLTFSCNFGEQCNDVVSRCGVNVTDCYNFTLEADVKEPHMYTWNRCFEVADKEDVQTSNCYNWTIANSTTIDCAVILNGQTCDSCEVVTTFYETFNCDDCVTVYYNYTRRCNHFDCTNVEGGWKGNDCNRLPEFLASYGCVDCSVCGPGERVTFPEGILVSASRSDLELDNATRCGDGPVLNDFTQEECDQIQSLADQVCGCVMQDEDGTPTNPPTEGTSGSFTQMMPSLSALTVTFLPEVALIVFG